MSKSPRLTTAQLNKLLGTKNLQETTVPKESKYKNKSVIIDGIKFDSIKEGNYYLFLKGEKQAGRIVDFILQVPYPIDIEGVKICTYIADFVVLYEKGAFEVVDPKGYKTPRIPAKEKADESYLRDRNKGGLAHKTLTTIFRGLVIIPGISCTFVSHN